MSDQDWVKIDISPNPKKKSFNVILTNDYFVFLPKNSSGKTMKIINNFHC
jgi:hypothetical protein